MLHVTGGKTVAAISASQRQGPPSSPRVSAWSFATATHVTSAARTNLPRVERDLRLLLSRPCLPQRALPISGEMAHPHHLPHLGLPTTAASIHSSHLFPTHASTMASLPDIAVKFRAAANRSRLPEPLRLFAYVFETDANDLAWYDEVYNVITSSDPDHLSAQHWFGSTAFIRTVNLIATVHQLEQPTDAGTLCSLPQ